MNQNQKILNAQNNLKKFPPATNERELAFITLYEIYMAETFSDVAINKNFNQVKLEAKQKGTAKAYIIGTITETIFCDELLSRFSQKPLTKIEPRVLVILRLGIWQLYFSAVKNYAAVAETVKLCRRFGVSSATSFVNAVLRNILRAQAANNISTFSVYAQTAFNQDIYALFMEALDSPEEVRELSNYLREGQALNVRLRRGIAGDKLPAALIAKLLNAENISTSKPSFQPEALHLETKGKSLHQSKVWRDGYILAQGESAMLPAQALGAKAGEKICDLCAAPGGKSILLSDLSENLANIYANDLQQYRVNLIRQEADRLKLTNIKTTNFDASIIEPWKAYQNFFDKALVDAPCSGLGLLQSKPELRFSFDREKVTHELLPLQAKILDVAAFILKPGATLVYSTCTLNRDENEAQVIKFLANHPEFSLVNFTDVLSREICHNLLTLDPGLAKQLNAGMLTLWPQRVQSEGFFIAVMHKAQ